MRLEWDPNKAASNLATHGVSFEEASEIFAPGIPTLETFDIAHSDESELRIQTLGPIRRGLVMVVWTERTADTVRIISARPASRRERRIYARYVKGSSS
jgi:uncharacterized DUF497 family protein